MESTAPSRLDQPGQHPEPPADLAQRQLPLRVVAAGETVFRIHSAVRDPLHFSRSGTGRFDAPHGEYGVVYVGSDVYCAFIETFGRALGYRLVTRAELEARAMAAITLSRPLRLVDLSGAGLAALGADGRLCTGDYAIAQRWSLAFWLHPERPDGLLWRSRFDPSRTCVGLYHRVESALAIASLGSLAHQRHATLLRDLLDAYQFGWLETS
ncbi:MAG: RES family NAD+ phosphorylase [Chloroflexi bacterium]|nr:RES family NAD+ phosphorylase [Chloroflexota bacterium]